MWESVGNFGESAKVSVSVRRRHNSRRGDKPLRPRNTPCFTQSFSCFYLYSCFDLSFDCRRFVVLQKFSKYNRVAKLRQLQQLKLPETEITEIAIRYWNDSQNYEYFSNTRSTWTPGLKNIVSHNDGSPS